MTPAVVAAWVAAAALASGAGVASAADFTAGPPAVPVADIAQLRPARPDEKVAVWHIPHPDDETIGMAGGIMADAAEGMRNIVVIYTNGEASDVRWILNGLVPSPLHGRRLNPAEEGYEPLDKTAFGLARVREAVAALERLGVEATDVWTVGLPDGEVTVDAALGVIRALDQRYPHAAHRTTSLSDPHPDHRSLARALYTFLNDKRRGAERPPDVRFYSVYTYHRPADRRAGGLSAVPVHDSDAKAQALAEYGVWAPDRGRFAIGMLSVPRLLAEAAGDPFEYVEPPPERIPLRHVLRRRADLTVFQNKAAVHVALQGRLQLRVGVTFAGDVRPPALLYEAPTPINAVKFRVGVAPTDWRLSGIRASHAGVAVFDRLLLEYEPPGDGQSPGLLRVGWRFRL